MPSSEDFEHLLDCRNVLGVEYDEETDTVRVYVSQKLDPEELTDEDDVTKRVLDRNVEVVDTGYGDEREGFDALAAVEIPDAESDRKDRHRPVLAGVSEINADSTAATAGPYPARVTDTAAGSWADETDSGEVVRLSNNHVYALVDEAEFGAPVVQPSPRDGGSLPDDKVGELRGYVPIEEGATVDVAARSADPDREAPEYHELPDEWPTAIRRDDYRSLRGETVTKTGRTTGVTSGTVEGVGASVRVNFGPDHGAITLRDQIITGPMSQGGDSGSPVFRDESGELVGLLFAGSANQTICNKIGNVESALGVELLTDEESGKGGEGGRGGGADEGGGDGGADEGDGDGGADEGDGTEGGDAPTFLRTFEETVSLPAATPELTLRSLTVAESPDPGETVAATARVVGSATGRAWLEVGDDRYRFEFGEADRRDADERTEYVRELAVSVTAPTEAGESFDVSVTGGYLLGESAD
jgi:hypothetical protein